MPPRVLASGPKRPKPRGGKNKLQKNPVVHQSDNPLFVKKFAKTSVKLSYKNNIYNVLVTSPWIFQ